MGKKKRKKSAFKKALLIWTLILLILGEAALIYVNNVLIEYEKGNITTYMDSLVKDIKSSAKRGNIDKYITLKETKSIYEDSPSLKNGYKTLFKDAKKVTYNKCTDCKENNVYILTVDNKNIAKIYLDGSENKQALVILNYNVWKIDKIEPISKGIYDFDIYLDATYNLKINDKKVLDSDLVENTVVSGYEEVKDIENVPKLNHYSVTNLTKKPNIEITDDQGKEITYTVKDGIYYASNVYKTKDEEDALKHLEHEMDVLSFAEMWSKFLTNDLTGSYHGYNQITPYVIEGTSMSKKAYDWSHNVDITFTSSHYLANPPFTNEKVTNFEIYNKNAFSAEVSLEKNMVLSRSKSKRVDKMHDRIYFIYVDNGYKVVKIESITD